MIAETQQPLKIASIQDLGDKLIAETNRLLESNSYRFSTFRDSLAEELNDFLIISKSEDLCERSIEDKAAFLKAMIEIIDEYQSGTEFLTRNFLEGIRQMLSLTQYPVTNILDKFILKAEKFGFEISDTLDGVVSMYRQYEESRFKSAIEPLVHAITTQPLLYRFDLFETAHHFKSYLSESYNLHKNVSYDLYSGRETKKTAQQASNIIKFVIVPFIKGEFGPLEDFNLRQFEEILESHKMISTTEDFIFQLRSLVSKVGLPLPNLNLNPPLSTAINEVETRTTDLLLENPLVIKEEEISIQNGLGNLAFSSLWRLDNFESNSTVQEDQELEMQLA